MLDGDLSLRFRTMVCASRQECEKQERTVLPGRTMLKVALGSELSLYTEITSGVHLKPPFLIPLRPVLGLFPT